MDVTRSGTRSPQGEDVATEGEGAEENDDQCAKDKEESDEEVMPAKRGRGGSKAKTEEEEGGEEKEADTALLLSRQFNDAVNVDKIKNPMAAKNPVAEKHGGEAQSNASV